MKMSGEACLPKKPSAPPASAWEARHNSRKPTANSTACLSWGLFFKTSAMHCACYARIPALPPSPFSRWLWALERTPRFSVSSTQPFFDRCRCVIRNICLSSNGPSTKGHYSYMSCPTNASGEHGCSFSFPMFRQFQALQDAFSSVVALGGDVGLNLRGNGPASFVHGEMVSGGFFETLGVGAAIGRTFAPADDTPGAPPVAVLAYGYWQSAFGGDPSVAGKTILLNNIPVTIVGVAAKEFPGLDPARARQIWLPLSLSPQLGKDLYGTKGGDDPSLEAGDGIWWVYSVARLKQGISLGQAQAAADAVFHNDVLDKTKELFKVEDAPRLVLMPAPQGISGLRDRFSTPL